MADVVTSAIRSRMMAGIKGKNSKPEIIVRQLLHGAGFRYRLHRRDLPGTPDIVLPGRKIAIFVQGCFWHAHLGCRYAKIPSTRADFWTAKLQGNVERDKRAQDQLSAMGWRVLLIWECSTRHPGTSEHLKSQILEWIRGNDGFGEIRL